MNNPSNILIFKAAFDQSPVPMAIVNPDNQTFHYANSSFERLISSIHGDPETMAISPDNVKERFNMSATPICCGAGAAYILLTGTGPMTPADLKSGAEGTAKHEDCYTFIGEILNSMGIMLGVLDYPDLRAVYVNKPVLEWFTGLFGRPITLSNVIGETAEEFFTEVPHPGFIKALKVAGETKSTCEVGNEYPIHDGTVRYARTVCSPLFDDGGRVTHIVVVSIDMSEAENTRVEIERLSAAKDEFLSICSHEMRTPLTVIAAGLQLLLVNGGKMNDDMKVNLLKSLTTQAHILKRLISDLLDISRLITGHLSISKQELDAGELVTGLVASYSQGCPTHSIELEQACNCRVEVDRERIEQILINLMSNAVRYSPLGSKIKVRMEQMENSLRIAVIDSGYGIAREDIPHLFEKYYKGAGSKEKSTGLGLGLYISNEIVKLHGGYIGVESELGEGSAFTISLPLSCTVPSNPEGDLNREVQYIRLR